MCPMTSCSSRAMRLRSAVLACSASPAWAARSWATRSIWWRISSAHTTVRVLPASHAAQPGSGFTHSHSAPNRMTRAAQQIRPSRWLTTITHQPASRHAANHPMSLARPLPSTAIAAMATAAASSGSRRE